jgi:uncharacterized membrane protein
MAFPGVKLESSTDAEAAAELEERLLEAVRRRERVSRNVNLLHEEQLTVGQRLADGLADVAGSWGFISALLVVIALWIGLNGLVLMQRPLDPFPFILLNLVLSLLAAMQAPVIMMSQNRQETKDRIRAEHDYAVNLKAELEIGQLHEKLDLLRETQWQGLLELQQRQITMLERQLQLLQELQGKG